jgi:hypothetical protein
VSFLYNLQITILTISDKMSEYTQLHQYDGNVVHDHPKQIAPWEEPNPANYPAANYSASESTLKPEAGRKMKVSILIKYLIDEV